MHLHVIETLCFLMLTVYKDGLETGISCVSALVMDPAPRNTSGIQ